MSLPSFSNFTKILSEDVIENICNECNQASSDIEGFGNKIGVQNYLMTIRLLELYHEWLSEQL